MDVVRNFLARYEQTREEEMSLEEYLDLCKREPMAYATAAERMLAAIGEPEVIDTRHDPRLSRIFGNKMVRIYPAFKDFYGLEEPIEQVVSHFRHAAQGLEEKKQILYLLGPVGVFIDGVHRSRSASQICRTPSRACRHAGSRLQVRLLVRSAS